VALDAANANRNNRLKSWFRPFRQFPIDMRYFAHGPHGASKNQFSKSPLKTSISLCQKLTTIGDDEIASAVLSVDF
jgi:hypothetical protein